MTNTLTPPDSRFVVATVKSPVIFHIAENETWLLNPKRRYILGARFLPSLHPMVETVSELQLGAKLKPLRAGADLHGASVLIERCRERGIGDLLFLTGPLAYLNHVTGGNVSVDVFALSDRGTVLTHSPHINNGVVLCGPLEYDHLAAYTYHWFIDSVTECHEEPDQLNVYDALYASLGYDYRLIDSRFKRPHAALVAGDMAHLDALYRHIFDNHKLDLRRTPYYVVAPFANASLRCAPYTMWLQAIQQMSAKRPVVVIGSSRQRLPDAGCSAGAFIDALGKMGPAVINAVDCTPSLRTLMAFVSRAKLLVSLDSGTLYVAQAFNVPAVSIWGTHNPGLRIGYDKAYMDLAVWNKDACPAAPCCSYQQFPASKCPNGERQNVCEVLQAVEPKQVLDKVEQVEANDVWIKQG